MKKILISLAAVIVAVVLFFGLGLGYIGTATTGKKIGNYNNPQKVLLVIDIQEDYTGVSKWSDSPFKKDSDSFIRLINNTSEKLRNKNFTVVYIKQEFEGFVGKTLCTTLFGGFTLKGAPGAEVDKRVTKLSDYSFSKPIGDTFSNREFESFLIDQQIDELYIVGLAGDGCVHATAKGALNRGYKVSIISDCILFRDENKRDKLMAEYRTEGIRLITSKDL